MALTTARINAAVDAALADFQYVQLHTGDPGADGTSNVATAVAAARLPISFSAATNRESAGTVTFAVTGASGPYTHITGWNASSGGTYQGSAALAPAESFAGPGSLEVEVILTGTAS